MRWANTLKAASKRLPKALNKVGTAEFSSGRAFCPLPSSITQLGTFLNKKINNTMAKEHGKNKRPSNREDHQKGRARVKSDKENSRWKAYKANGGDLAKSAWKKAGMHLS